MSKKNKISVEWRYKRGAMFYSDWDHWQYYKNEKAAKDAVEGLNQKGENFDSKLAREYRIKPLIEPSA